MKLIHHTMMNLQNKRAINGILLVNKPTSITSNALLQKVKRLMRAKKAGHTGSLDPLATGMLPICLGEATKFSQYLLDADKNYTVTARLGIKTNTADATGEVTYEHGAFELGQEELVTTLAQFRGFIEQIPSMYSALKHQGKPLYQYARAGIDIARPARSVQIYTLDLIAFTGNEFTLNVTCSKGTYIRNLVEDIGDALQIGAHVTALHRNYTAGFAKESMFTLEELESMSLEMLDSHLLPMDRAIASFETYTVDSMARQRLNFGQIIEVPETYFINTLLRLYAGNDFIGLGEIIAPGQLKSKRLIAY